MLGYKKEMTQLFVQDRVIPVTVVEVPGNTVLGAGRPGGEGENRVDIGIGEKKHPSKAEAARFKVLSSVPLHIWTVAEAEIPGKGHTFGAEIFAEGDVVSVTGISKAKGFAGVVKRWNFSGGPKTRGQSDRHRSAGSIGAGTDPGRVLPGKKMAGRMGGKTITISNKRIMSVGEGYIAVRGPLPGNPGGLLKIRIDTKHES